MEPDSVSIVLDGTLRENLSAAVQVENTLWLGVDEGTCLERVSTTDGQTYDYHRRFDLREILDLPGDKEIDIEGLDYAGGYLWLVGAHCLKRKAPREDASGGKNRKRLRTIEREINRYTLARVPLVRDSESDEVVVGRAVKRDGQMCRAAQMEGAKNGNILSKELERDEHIGSFTAIPSKDNGLDIEGLAVAGDTVFAGLRGPVLRGWAVVLRMQVKGEKKGRLRFERIGKDEAIFAKHFLYLDGNGVRDLIIDGEDLIILAGPTMDLPGPVVTYRWKGALTTEKAKFVWAKDLVRSPRLPLENSDGKPEGLARLTREGRPPGLLVVYDSPGPSRRVGANEVRADVFPFQV